MTTSTTTAKPLAYHGTVHMMQVPAAFYGSPQDIGRQVFTGLVAPLLSAAGEQLDDAAQLQMYAGLIEAIAYANTLKFDHATAARLLLATANKLSPATAANAAAATH